jgi:hypothetical protein
MKYFFMLTLICAQARAVTVEVTAPCENKPVILTSQTLSNKLPTSAGAMTIQVLQDLKVAFTGSESGIQSIYQTPTGDDSVDVISDRELYAYGWCYHVNQQEPGEMPDQLILQSDTDHIRWFYAFSHYKDGHWISMCTPAYQRPLMPYCK